MTHQRLRRTTGSVALLALASLVALAMTSCGADTPAPTRDTSALAAPAAPARAVIAQVGSRPLTGATYDHWIAIGDATVEKPQPTGPLPKAVAYAPPGFTACIAHLHTISRNPTTTIQLRAKCHAIYDGIQRRILDFLIAGYWLRAEAAEQHASVTAGEVKNKFEEERRLNYPTAASFRRLQETSRQTVPDLMFATQTAMLSTKLLERFTKTQPKRAPEQATIAAFNKSIKTKWVARTHCRLGFVVPDCSEYQR